MQIFNHRPFIKVLVAVNPYKRLDVYGVDKLKEYATVPPILDVYLKAVGRGSGFDTCRRAAVGRAQLLPKDGIMGVCMYSEISKFMYPYSLGRQVSRASVKFTYPYSLGHQVCRA